MQETNLEDRYMRFVIVTGMSGAGKSTTLKTLEDMGYFCVDNLPIQLIKRFAQIAYGEDNDINNVAIGVDIRSGVYLEQLSACLSDLKQSRYDYEILFLDSNDDVLIKRYKETRRNHPLARSGRIEDGIKKERSQIAFLRKEADYIIDTTSLLTRELKAELDKIFIGNAEYNNFIVTVVSFGFKYGIPKDVDMVFDVRFLPNPYYDLELRPLTGNDEAVQNFALMGKVEMCGAATFTGAIALLLCFFRFEVNPVRLLAVLQMPATSFVVNFAAGESDHLSHMRLLSEPFRFLMSTV